MHALKEQTFIDTTLVTHAEYQLFLDELRSRGKYYQPDHWTNLTFLAGQGRQPALGIRYSDAQAFCVWLSEWAGGTWHYRLPNEKDLAQVDQSIQKNLSQDTGYWTEGERGFVWSQGQPSHSLYTLLQAALVRARKRNPALPRILDFDGALDLERARYLATARDPVFVRTLIRADVRASDLTRPRPSDFDLALGRGLDLALVTGLDLVLTRDPARNLDLSRILDLTINLSNTLNLPFDIYIHLFLLQERRARRLPAWEGILLVKERILDG